MKTILITFFFLSGIFLKAQNDINTIQDIDGNFYNTVKIGTQVWMVENLKTSRYTNGDIIPNVTDDKEWTSLTTGAWCYYDNNSENNNLYGKLYNWYTVTDSRSLCPNGWHVPIDEEWDMLISFLGKINVGEKIKSSSGWKNNGNGNNISKLSITPNGLRHYWGTFEFIGSIAYYWSSSIGINGYMRARFLSNFSNRIDNLDSFKGSGFSVRCIKDE